MGHLGARSQGCGHICRRTGGFLGLVAPPRPGLGSLWPQEHPAPCPLVHKPSEHSGGAVPKGTGSGSPARGEVVLLGFPGALPMALKPGPA